MGSDATHDYDYVIVGAGPAGIQLAYFMSKTDKKYIVLEGGDKIGTFFRTNPRHRTLISINKIYNVFPEEDFNMRHDWNSLISDDPTMKFTKYTDKLFPHTDYLVDYMEDYVNHFKLNIKCSTWIEKVARCPKTKKFIFKEKNGVEYTSPVAVMATGACGINTPKIPGIELATTYSTHTLDQEYYKNKAVCIVGGGNSGFECGDHLAGHAGFLHYFLREKVKFAWDSHYVGNLRAVNNATIDMYHLKSLAAFRQGHIKKVTKEFDPETGKDMLFLHYDMELSNWSPPGTGHFTSKYDEIIFCTGWKYINSDIYEDNIKPALTPDGRLPVLDEMWMSSTEDMYFCGAPMHSRDRLAASGFIHGFRYNTRVLFNLLMHKYHQIELPRKVFPKFDLQAFADFLLMRMSTTAALYQLNHGFLCDVIIFRDSRTNKVVTSGSKVENTDDITIEYIYEIPTEWVKKQKMFMELPMMWTMKLGDARKKYAESINPTFFIGPPDMTKNNWNCSAFTEPIFDVYKNGNHEAEYHVGPSVVVRLDIPQLPGANQDKTVNKMKNWMVEQLDLGTADFDESFWDKKQKYFGYVTPLTQEELKAARDLKAKKEAMKREMYTCDIKHYTG